LLVVSGIGPLPLINVLPAVTIALMAIALLQEDGLLLAISFGVGILSLLVFGFLTGSRPAPSGISWAARCTCLGRKAERRGFKAREHARTVSELMCTGRVAV
jgi:hypothetical protein